MNSHTYDFSLPAENTKDVTIQNGIMQIEDETGDRYQLPLVDTMVSFLALDFSVFDTLFEEDFTIEEIEETMWEFIESHPYLRFFYNGFDITDLEICAQYYDYLSYIHTKFNALFSFCFVNAPEFQELFDCTATQRLHIFTQTPIGFIPQELTEVKAMDADVLESFEEDEDATPSPLESLLGIPAGCIQYMKKHDVEMVSTYALSSIFDALTLEFYHMIARNMKLKKCKHCGRYFEVKTKRNPDYCDRVFEGSTQTCQQIMATKNFKEKTKDSAPYNVFNLYYKRYHERKKVGTVKADAFDKWNRTACTLRDACIDGKGDVNEFEQWCYDSFPNRKRKEK